MQSRLKKAYFAAPFIYDIKGSLRYDPRALILGSEERLLINKQGDRNPEFVFEGERYEYTGPFYFEETANGVFTDSDCYGVVKKELSMLDECDVLFVILDGTLAPGTVTELIYAVMKQKDIRLYYKRESADYDIDSFYWYPIVAAQTIGESVTITPFSDYKDLMSHFGIFESIDYDSILSESNIIKRI